MYTGDFELGWLSCLSGRALMCSFFCFGPFTKVCVHLNHAQCIYMYMYICTFNATVHVHAHSTHHVHAHQFIRIHSLGVRSLSCSPFRIVNLSPTWIWEMWKKGTQCTVHVHVHVYYTYMQVCVHAYIVHFVHSVLLSRLSLLHITWFDL